VTVLDPGRRPAGHHRPPVARAAGPVSFGTTVLLTKAEVFGACQALADADRALLRVGRAPEAAALGDLFELLEQRLSVVASAAQAGVPAPPAAPSGSNSSDRELTQ
jgi:hypothetical protein